MSENSTATIASETTPPPAAAAITPAPVATTAAPAATTFSQDDVNRLTGQAREEGKKAAQDEAKRKRAEDEAKAKGEWEQVATAKDAEVERLKAELADRDRALLVAKVAARHKLPDALATRLIGATEADLEADAKALAKEIGTRPAPDTEAGAGHVAHTGPTDLPRHKKPDGPVYSFDRSQKVPWPDRAPDPRTTAGTG